MITRNFARFFFGVLLTLAYLSGCIQQPKPTPTPTITPTPPGAPLFWEKIAEDDGSAGEYRYEDATPRMLVVANAGMANALQNQVRPSYLDVITQTDFSTYFVLVIYQGHKFTTEYSVEVLDVRQVDNMLTIYVLFHTPQPSGPDGLVITGQLETSPYYILKVRKTEEMVGELTFALNANGQDVTRQTQTIP